VSQKIEKHSQQIYDITVMKKSIKNKIKNYVVADLNIDCY
jgi:predicted small metal-binding protein